MWNVPVNVARLWPVAKPLIGKRARACGASGVWAATGMPPERKRPRVLARATDAYLFMESSAGHSADRGRAAEAHPN
jgi:hypothetical protein